MLELNDYFEILKRRKWLLLTWLVVGLAGAGVTFFLMPKVYRSSTLILVESQKVPTDYIKPMAVDTIEERLITIQQQILSRTLLQKIIEEFGLYKDELKRQPLEDVIDMMRRDIRITTVDDRFHRNIQAFTISYDGEDPLTVMQVTNKLASLFIAENLKVREQLVEGTAEFLEHELQRVKEKLDRQEAEISRYKQKYIGELPQQGDALLRQLDRLTIELQTHRDILRMLTERREIMRDAIETSVGTPGGVIHLSPRGRLRQLREQLERLSDYKDTYPDVVAIKKEIKQLEERIARGPSKDDLEDEVVASSDLDSQLRTIDAEIKVRRQRSAELEGQIKALEQRIEALPIREQELSVLLRDYENTNKQYQMLLANKESAKITEHLEKRQKGEQFRILDPANLPIKPVKPNPVKVFFGGIFAGLVLGGGTVWWLDFRNLPFRRPEEVEAVVGLPMLASIPRMFTLGGDDQGDASQRDGQPTWWRRWIDPFRLLPARDQTNGALQPRSARRSSRGRSLRVLRAHMNALGAEQFRVLAGRVVQAREKKGARVLAVTSSLSGEGKTTVALGLAVTLARDYLEETILIDGDMRNPEVSSRFGLQDEKGMIDVLAGECEVNQALYQHHTYPGLWILAAGTIEQRRRGLTATRLGMQELLANLKQRDVFVILDAPPILPMADMNLYSEVVDGIVLVIRADQTPQQVVGEALRFLAGGSIEGAVLNDLEAPRHQYYGRYAIAEHPPVL